MALYTKKPKDRRVYTNVQLVIKSSCNMVSAFFFDVTFTISTDTAWRGGGDTTNSQDPKEVPRPKERKGVVWSERVT